LQLVEPWLKTTTPTPPKAEAVQRGPWEARRPLRLYPVRLLLNGMPELLVDLGW